MAKPSLDDDREGDMGALSERLVERRQSSEAESPRFRFSGVVQLGQVLQFFGVIVSLTVGAYWIGNWRAGYDDKLANGATRLTEVEVKVNRIDDTLRALSAYDAKFVAINQRFLTDETAVAQVDAKIEKLRAEIQGSLSHISDGMDTIRDRLPRQGSGR